MLKKSLRETINNLFKNYLQFFYNAIALNEKKCIMKM